MTVDHDPLTPCSAAEPCPSCAPRRPAARIYPAVRLTLAVTRTTAEAHAGIWVPDDGTIARFAAWVTASRVLPIDGTCTAGPGFYSAFFAARHDLRLRQWLADESIL